MPQISIKQLEKMETKSFENAIRLHFDAFKLFDSKSYSSAYFLDVLALEEIGKAAIIDFIIYHTNLGDLDEEYRKKYIESLYQHKGKQMFFFSNYFDPLHTRRLQSIFKKMETNKQNAVYVGIKKRNNHLIIPNNYVNHYKAKKQLQLLNDILLKGTQDLISYDNEKIEKLLKNKKISSEIKRIKKTLSGY
jgi:AbiV family abortive infection protein